MSAATVRPAMRSSGRADALVGAQRPGQRHPARPEHHPADRFHRRQCSDRSPCQTGARCHAGRAPGSSSTGSDRRGLEVLLGHPGGPAFRARDHGHWSVPKGEVEGDEALEAVARREFEEETGHAVPDRPDALARRHDPEGRQAGRRLGGGGRPRPAHGREQHVRDGVAAPIRASRAPTRRSIGSPGSRRTRRACGSRTPRPSSSTAWRCCSTTGHSRAHQARLKKTWNSMVPCPPPRGP